MLKSSEVLFDVGTRRIVRVTGIAPTADKYLRTVVPTYFGKIPPPPLLNPIDTSSATVIRPKVPRKAVKELVSEVLIAELTTFPPPPPAPPESKPKGKVAPTLSVPRLIEPEKKPSLYEQAPDVSYLAASRFKEYYSTYIAIDTEATGLGNGHAITELAAVKMRNFQPSGEFFHSHINPNRPVSTEAERITGYNWHKLREFPQFRDIIENFSRFISTHPLVFHNAHFDCKLINEGKRGTKHSSDLPLSATNAIIDTQKLSNELFPNRANSLMKLAEKYQISSLLQDQMHGALSDAMQLIGVFRELIKENKGQFYTKSPINWELVPEINIDKEFEHVMHTDGELFFRRLGVICEIPQSFRFSNNMYNPLTGENLPAIISKLSSFENELTGYYVRFLEPLRSTSTEPLKNNTKLVFGSENNGMIDIEEGTLDTLVIGSVSAVLHVLSLKKYFSNPEKFQRLFNANAPITIKALTSISHLPTIQFSPSTKKVFIVLQTAGVKLSDIDRRVLTTIIDLHLHPQFLPLIQVATQVLNLARYKVKYKQIDWLVVEDKTCGKKRIVRLEKTHEPTVILEIDVNDRTIVDAGTLIESPNVSVLVANPTIEFSVIRCGKAECFQERKNTVHEYYKRIMTRVVQHCPLSSQRDIQFIETCEEARNAYSTALPITEDSPAKQYFMGRGIVSELPIGFKYLNSVYHPGIEKYLPATLIPLFNEENTIVGVHRIFCGENGERLAKQNKIPPKLSLGRTAGAAFEIFATNTDPEACFISEGFENGLVARDAIKHMFMTPIKEKEFLDKFNIQSFSIKSCVGINGLIDIPFETSVHTVVILADNDEKNPDVKRTLNLTINSFLKRGLKIYFAMPRSTELNKRPDLNDVYCVDGGQKPEVVFDVLLKAIAIKTADPLTKNEISIEEELFADSKKSLLLHLNSLENSHIRHRSLHKLKPMLQTGSCDTKSPIRAVVLLRER